MSYREGGYRNTTRWVGVLVMLLALGWCASVPVMQRIGANMPTPENIERSLVTDSRNGELFKTLRETFPNDFRVLRDELSGKLKAGASPAQVAELVRNFMGRSDGARTPLIMRASHAELAAVRQAEIILLDHLSLSNPTLCATYVMQNEIKISPTDYKSDPLLQLFYIAKLRAAAAGRDRPEIRTISPPTKTQWGEVGRLMLTQGATPVDLQTFAKVDTMAGAPKATQCRIGLALLRAINQLPPNAVDQFYLGQMQTVPASNATVPTS